LDLSDKDIKLSQNASTRANILETSGKTGISEKKHKI
jgi:hypothetical protein